MFHFFPSFTASAPSGGTFPSFLGIFLLLVLDLHTVWRARAEMVDILTQIRPSLRRISRQRTGIARRTTTTTSSRHKSVTRVEEEDVEPREIVFKGQIWPKGKYGVHVDLDEFKMTKDEKLKSRHAKPYSVDTGEDGAFEAAFLVDSIDDPDIVYMHIFGGKKEPHMEMDVPVDNWDEVHILDLSDPKEAEVLSVRPRKVDEELKKLEERDKKKGAGGAEKKPAEPAKKPGEKVFAGLVWPVTDKYTLHVDVKDFELNPQGNPVKKRRFHTDPAKAAFDEKGLFEAKLHPENKIDALYVWVRNTKTGTTKKFVVPNPDLDNYKYALDVRKLPAGKEVEPFKRLDKILEQLKKAGMDTKQIPKAEAKPAAKPAEAPKKAEAPAAKPAAAAPAAKPAAAPAAGANAELQKSIQKMIDELGSELEKKIEKENSKLRKEIEKDIEEKVGKRLDAMDKKLANIQKEIKDMDKHMGQDIADSIRAEFDKLYKKRLVGKFEGR